MGFEFLWEQQKESGKGERGVSPVDSKESFNKSKTEGA